MAFAAQIDMAEVAAAAPMTSLPRSGALAFFLDPGAVVFIPEGTATTPTKPPPGTVAFEPGGDIVPKVPSPWARTEFPFWPLQLTPMPIAPVVLNLDREEADGERPVALAKAVTAQFERPQYVFTAKQIYEATRTGSVPLWGHGVSAYAERLRIAGFHGEARLKRLQAACDGALEAVERLRPGPLLGVFGRRETEALQKALAQLRFDEERTEGLATQAARFGPVVAEVEAFAAGLDPWQQLSADEAKAFSAMFDRVRSEFPDLAQHRTPHSCEDLATESLLAMITGDEAAFRAMPIEARDQMNARWRIPTRSQHQMFGPPLDVQGSAVLNHADDHLLLQLVYDDMLDWRFGDMGVYQFWIPPNALAARDWGAAEVTFECH